MSFLGGRGGRSDDWSTQHERARARLSERLDGPLDPDESRWLDEHLASCDECAVTAVEYAAQRLELRALRDRTPAPPRDLWARTATAIEREARHRSLQPRGGPRPSTLAPYALLAGAVAVAVVVGTLTSSRPSVVPTVTPAASNQIAVASNTPPPVPTPLAVARQEVEYVSLGRDGESNLNTTRISEVCPPEAGPCATTQPSEVVSLGPLASPETVFGSGDAPLVVLGDSANGSSVYAVARPDKAIDPGSTPSSRPSASATATASPSQGSDTSGPPPSASSGPLRPTPSASTAPPSQSPPPAGTVEIASGLDVVDTTAAYAPDGSAFAFTARPSDGSHGPDIYLWKVGDPEARPITTDHRSVFGSWVGDTVVGSTVETTAEGLTGTPAAFVLATDGQGGVSLPQAGLAWRPVVDPTGGAAVYWAGTLEPADDELGWRTVAGQLVIGRWSAVSEASDDAQATPLTGNQSVERAETTIAEGPLADWDARWDETGTRLAVWVADAEDPTVGSLSLYVVDPFDGRIDLANPPLEEAPALAGFSIADGRLAWAAPAGNSGKAKHVRILAWTNEGFGQVESTEGDFLLVR
jgi:hypothetical protein